MFRRFALIFAMIFSLVSIPSAVFADTYGLERTAGAAKYDVNNDTIYNSVEKVVSAFLGLLAIIFFILVTYAGVRWMIARGNEEYVEEAKNTLESAIIGLVVITAAYAITTFIFTKLSVETVAKNEAPTVVTTPSGPVVVGCAAMNGDRESCVFSSLSCDYDDAAGVCVPMRQPTGPNAFPCDTGSNGAGTYFCAGQSQCSGSDAKAPDTYQSCGTQICCMHIDFGVKCKASKDANNNNNWCETASSCDGPTKIVVGDASVQDCDGSRAVGQVCCGHNIQACTSGFPNSRCMSDATCPGDASGFKTSVSGSCSASQVCCTSL